MKDTVRVSFDVPLEDHTFLKAFCVTSHVAFKDLMQDVFHKTAQSIRKQEFHNRLKDAIEESYEKPGIMVTKKYIDELGKRSSK